MRTFPDEKIGGAVIRIVADKGAYSGRIFRKGQPPGAVHSDADLDALRTLLRNEAGKLHPDYIGMDYAITRFLHFFPDGFGDIAYLHDERTYKVEAQDRLRAVLPLDAAADASAADAVAVRKAFAKTNILHTTELARAHELLGGANGAAYVRAAARFARGDLASGLAGMVAAIAPHGRSSWPLLTYLPSLWLPERHMFLKPSATCDFAQRIGHEFQHRYAATPDAAVYSALLDLVADTEAGLSALKPQDRTDVQSFIWVIGDYTDAEMPRLERLRASA